MLKVFFVMTVFSAQQQPVIDLMVLDRVFESKAECQEAGPELFDKIRRNVFSEKVKDTGAEATWECRIAR